MSSTPSSSSENSFPEELFLPLDKGSLHADHLSRPQLSYWQDVWRRFKKSKTALAGFCILVVLTIMALIGPELNHYTYYETNLKMKNTPPCSQFWFGSDDLGRDLFTRVWFGARISLSIGIIAAFLDLVIGVLWGSVAAFTGGKIDEMMMRFADVLYSIPSLLVVIMLMVVLGSGISTIIIALSITGWISMARIVRGQILLLKEQEFVMAAKALGAQSSRIILKHLIPNVMGPIIVTVTLTIPSAIFVEAFLSFLGLGVQAPIASWGTMANDGLPALRYYPWRLFFPAFFISMTMFSFNLVGDGLRDALDPRLRK